MTKEPITLTICYKQIYYYASAIKKKKEKPNRINLILFIFGRVIGVNKDK